MLSLLLRRTATPSRAVLAPPREMAWDERRESGSRDVAVLERRAGYLDERGGGACQRCSVVDAWALGVRACPVGERQVGRVRG